MPHLQQLSKLIVPVWLFAKTPALETTGQECSPSGVQNLKVTENIEKDPTSIIVMSKQFYKIITNRAMQISEEPKGYMWMGNRA